MASVGPVAAQEADADRPRIILVHGAANSAAVWRFWQQDLARLGWHSHAINLRGHSAGPAADLSVTSMRDYADDVSSLSEPLSPKPIMIGWSMGGLVAMMVAARGLASACVGLAPSAPALRQDDTLTLRQGVFGPEEYDIVSHNAGAQQPSMPDLDAEERAIALSSLASESRLARDERKRGIVVSHVPCPLLIVTGELEPERQRATYEALQLPADYLSVEGCSHWGLVLNRRALARTVPLVSHWMTQAVRA